MFANLKRGTWTREKQNSQIRSALWDIWQGKRVDLCAHIQHPIECDYTAFREDVDSLLFGARNEILVDNGVLELEQQGLNRLLHVDRAIWSCRKTLFGTRRAGDHPPIRLNYRDYHLL